MIFKNTSYFHYYATWSHYLFLKWHRNCPNKINYLPFPTVALLCTNTPTFQNTYRMLKAFWEISCYWQIWRFVWVVNSRSCVNPLCFRWTYNFGSHTGEIEGFMPCKWQGRLVFAPVWLVHEDQEMSTRKWWSEKNSCWMHIYKMHIIEDKQIK